MSTVETLHKRRSYYVIGDDVTLKKDEIVKTIQDVVELSPHAFNTKSTRVAVVLGEKNKQLWDLIYDVFEGAVAREKIDSFKAGYGTVLYYYEKLDIEKLQEQYPPYAQNFPWWTAQALGMLQLSVWNALRDIGLGASLQHYNPVIDEKLREFLNIPEGWVLNAQMPFGEIKLEPEERVKEDISQRVKIFE